MALDFFEEKGQKYLNLQKYIIESKKSLVKFLNLQKHFENIQNQRSIIMHPKE